MSLEQWLTSIGKSPKTAKNYAGAIAGGLSSWAADAGLVRHSLHELTTVEDFLQACVGIRQLAIYDARNTRGKGMYNAALSTYADYLADITQNDIEKDLSQIVEDSTLSDTEKASLVNTRIGQGQFRKQLIAQWGGCAVFDLGYISFEASGLIRISGELEALETLGIHDQLKAALADAHQGYLEYHRNEVFRR